MGHQKSFSTVHDDDFEFDEAYFRQFYKPLSNLPTPPPSSRNSSASPQSSCFSADVGEKLNTEFLGPAAHLARMLPPGASFMTPSFTVVQEMLVRADLPMDVIALAVCILDSLTWKFSRSWRASFPLSPIMTTTTTTTTTNPDTSTNAGADEEPEQQPSPPRHIDSVFPEVIILGALVIASKFTEDVQESTRYFSTAWGRGLWSCEQINFTERCIMESLGYHIMPLWSASHIKQARHDIEMARRELLDEDVGADTQTLREGRGGGSSAKHSKSKSAGHALGLGRGLQLTPAETPTSEAAESPFDRDHQEEHQGLRRQGRRGQGQGQTQNLRQETQDAFSQPMDLPNDYLHLPGEATPR